MELLCVPFSTAVVERGFSAVRRIVTDWRCQLGPNLISDCLHMSTRRSQLKNKAYRDLLIDRACDSFLSEHEMSGASDGLGMLTSRRINKILNGLEVNVTDTSKDCPSTSLSRELIEISSQSESEKSEQSESSDSDVLSDNDEWWSWQCKSIPVHKSRFS